MSMTPQQEAEAQLDADIQTQHEVNLIRRVVRRMLAEDKRVVRRQRMWARTGGTGLCELADRRMPDGSLGPRIGSARPYPHVGAVPAGAVVDVDLVGGQPHMIVGVAP